MALQAAQHDLSSLRKCVSAGEALPAATRKLWHDATGIQIIDGIGSTELLHIFISATRSRRGAVPPATRSRATRPACLVTTASRCRQVRSGGWRCKGPTGCKYLADGRQTTYVQDGWNLTGDAYLIDRSMASSSTRHAPTT